MNKVYVMPEIEHLFGYPFKTFEVPEDATHIRLFHGTSTVFADRIISKGLLNPSTSGEMIDSGDWASNPQYISLGHPYRSLNEYSARTVNKRGGLRMLVEVELPIDHRLEEDGEENRQYFGGWEKSLEYSLICTHRGNLTSSNTQAIYIFNMLGKLEDLWTGFEGKNILKLDKLDLKNVDIQEVVEKLNMELISLEKMKELVHLNLILY